MSVCASGLSQKGLFAGDSVLLLKREWSVYQAQAIVTVPWLRHCKKWLGYSEVHLQPVCYLSSFRDFSGCGWQVLSTIIYPGCHHADYNLHWYMQQASYSSEQRLTKVTV